VSGSSGGGSGASGSTGGGSGVTMETTDPLITNNGTLGELWLNTTSGELYACTDITTDDNIWTNIGDGTGNITSNVPPENPTNTTIADKSNGSLLVVEVEVEITTSVAGVAGVLLKLV
jgi:hypothetical protein